MTSRSLSLTFLLFLLLSASLWAKGQEAWFVTDKKFMASSDVQAKEGAKFIHKIDREQITFGNFADAEPGQPQKAWDVFDIVYKDLPVVYQTALVQLAHGKGKEAHALFLKSEDADTQSGKAFKDTEMYKQLYDDKILQCARLMGDEKLIDEAFAKVFNNKSTFTWVRNMVDYLDFLRVKMDGRKMGKVAQEVLKIKRLPPRIKGRVEVFYQLALAHSGKSSVARKGLVKIENNNDYKRYESVKVLAQEVKSDILIYIDKNYSEGIRFFEKKLKEDVDGASADTYIKLAMCYAKQRNLHKARWNYLQAYLSAGENKDLRNRVTTEVASLKEKISDDGGAGDMIERYFKKIEELESAAN